jgi:hypothetical protein
LVGLVDWYGIFAMAVTSKIVSPKRL